MTPIREKKPRNGKQPLLVVGIIAGACLLIIGASLIGLNLWAKHCIRLHGFGTEFRNPLQLTFVKIDFSERPTLIYTATFNSLFDHGQVTETIAIYDIYSFGQMNTGLMGG